MSKDGLRKMRFDFNNSQNDLPYVHLEIFRNGRWRDAIPGTHRIYPQPEKTEIMLTAIHKGNKFEIVQDKPEVGVYLYVYDDDRCIRDELQNDIETCVEIAFEDYGVPKAIWKSNPTDSAKLT